MNNPSDNDKLTALFVRVLQYFDIKSEENVTDFVSNSEWMHYYLDNIGPIKLKHYVLLNNYTEKIWLEVVLTEQFLEINQNRSLGSKLYLGKIISMVSNKPYNYGSMAYFTLSQVLEHFTFEELLNLYIKK